MSTMFLSIRAGDQDIINIDKEEILEASAHLIHESLERLRCVLEAKWHAEKFEETEGCYYRCLGDVGSCNGDLVVSTYQVNF